MVRSRPQSWRYYQYEKQFRMAYYTCTFLLTATTTETTAKATTTTATTTIAINASATKVLHK